MPYRLLMLSSIPVHWDGSHYRTMDLWAVDLNGQIAQTSSVTLICPIVEQVPDHWTSSAQLPAGVRVVNPKSLDRHAIDALVSACDVVQVHGGGAWTESRLARQLVSAAGRLKVKSIVGISSNRARTALLNRRGGRGVHQLARSLKSVARYASVNWTYRTLTSQADGTFIVGEGLRSLVSPRCPSLHVGTASWIRHSDIVAARAKQAGADREGLARLCIAARLERMKGVHLGIEAASILDAAGADFTLDIYGAGPELAALHSSVEQAGLGEKVQFRGTVAYPQPFLSILGSHGVVLLTNLNDEQPRLVFDAISQGTLPICPNSRAYEALGLPKALLYEPGRADSMSEVLTSVWKMSPSDLAGIWEELFAIAERCTLDSMHALRAKWIRSAILNQEHPKAP